MRCNCTAPGGGRTSKRAEQLSIPRCVRRQVGRISSIIESIFGLNRSFMGSMMKEITQPLALFWLRAAVALHTSVRRASSYAALPLRVNYLGTLPLLATPCASYMVWWVSSTVAKNKYAMQTSYHRVATSPGPSILPSASLSVRRELAAPR